MALAPATAVEIVAAVTTLLSSFGDGLDDDTALRALTVTNAPVARSALSSPTKYGGNPPARW